MSELDASNRSELLDAEAAMLAAMLAATRSLDARGAAAVRDRRRFVALAAELETRLADAIERGRARATENARRQHELEAGAVAALLLWPKATLTDPKADKAVAAVEGRELGANAARVSARSLSRAWLALGELSASSAVANDQVARPRSLIPSGRVGADNVPLSAKLVHRVERTAATETAAAYNDERQAIVARVVAKEPAIAPLLMWHWDAVLDRATCAYCRSMDGRKWHVSEPLPSRPPVHPRCRCVLSLRAASRAKAA